MIEVLRSVPEWRAYRRRVRSENSIGFVPTMGGLHEGHASLARRSTSENDLTVVSLFLNRTQFNQASDFESYPANFEQDMALLDDLGVDAVFAPEYDSMYPDSYRYRVVEDRDSKTMEGEQRPGHFDGVLTVVLKLLSLVDPERAYFGEKDFQQLQLVKGMVDAFFLPVEIVPCETARTDEGLALSSRNRRLSESAREKASQFPKILNTAPSAAEAIKRLKKAGFSVEYVVDQEGRRFGAVNLEGVRLIDNWALSIPERV